VLLGIGKDASLRGLLNGASREITRHGFDFDWLGDYAFVGVADRSELAEAARWNRETSPEMLDARREGHEAEAERALARTPAYAGIAIRSVAGATVALALLKNLADDVAHGSIVWKEARTHRGVSVTSIHGTGDGLEGFTLYYALTPHTLLFSMNSAILDVLIDQTATGVAPVTIAGKGGPRDAQLVVDLKGKQAGPLYTVLAWVLSNGLSEGTAGAYDSINALYRGAPEVAGDPKLAAQWMRNYFGSVIHTPEGRDYGFGPDGVRDPLRGSLSSPQWPVIPVPGSPVAQVFDRLESLRSQVSFDDEPNGGQTGQTLQSLRVHLSLSLR
jgi:hypothetical protein